MEGSTIIVRPLLFCARKVLHSIFNLGANIGLFGKVSATDGVALPKEFRDPRP